MRAEQRQDRTGKVAAVAAPRWFRLLATMRPRSAKE